MPKWAEGWWKMKKIITDVLPTEKFTTNLVCMLVIFGLLLSGVVAQADHINLPVIWSQLPDMDNYANQYSVHEGDAVCSSDFVCGDDAWTSSLWPVAAVRFWGSYLDGYDPGNGTNSQSFIIDLHFDMPAGEIDPETGEVLPYSHPGGSFSYMSTGVQEDYYGTTSGGEKIFEYNFYLPVMSIPKPSSPIYWIDIAYYGDHPWGWSESQTDQLGLSISNPEPQWHVGPWANVTVLDRDLAIEVMVPEPFSLSLLALGGMALLRKKRR